MAVVVNISFSSKLITIVAILCQPFLSCDLDSLVPRLSSCACKYDLLTLPHCFGPQAIFILDQLYKISLLRAKTMYKCHHADPIFTHKSNHLIENHVEIKFCLQKGRLAKIQLASQFSPHKDSKIEKKDFHYSYF